MGLIDVRFLRISPSTDLIELFNCPGLRKFFPSRAYIVFASAGSQLTCDVHAGERRYEVHMRVENIRGSMDFAVT